MVNSKRETETHPNVQLVFPIPALIRADNPEQETLSALNLLDPVTDHRIWSIRYDYESNGNLHPEIPPAAATEKDPMTSKRQ